MPALDELTRAPEDKAVEDRALESDAKEALNRYSPAEKVQIGTTLDTIRRLQSDIDFASFESPALSGAWTSLHNNPMETISISTKGEEALALAEKQAQFLLTRSDSAAARKYNLRRYLAGVLGLNVPAATIGVTFELISRFASGKQVDSVPATGGFKDDVQQAVEMLRKEKDVDYWNRLRGFCRTNPVTPTDLLYFMQYTQALFPLQEPFVWTTAADKRQVVNELTRAGNAAGGVDCTKLVLELVSGLKYGQIFLPRAVAANCAALGLAALATGRA